MRVIVFTTLFPNAVEPSQGTFVLERLRHLVARHDIDAVVVAPVPYFPTVPGFGRWSKMAAVPSREVIEGLPVYHPRYLVTPKVGMSLYPVTLALSATRLIARLRRDGYELVDAHYLYPDAVAAALLTQQLHMPLVVTGRGSDINYLPEFRIPRRWIGWALRRADGRAAVCTALAHRMQELGGGTQPTTVLRNGVDATRFAPGNRAAARRVLGLSPHDTIIASVGSLIERKGHHLAIEALAQLRREGRTNLRLLIVGSGPEQQRLRRQAQQLAVDDSVILHGTLPHAEIARVFVAADLLLLASRSEGWANVLLEALACGTPVVATAVPGTVEAAGSPDVGVLFSERSGAGVAAALRQGLGQSWNAKHIRAYAESFSWDETSDGQVALFDAARRHHAARRQLT